MLPVEVNVGIARQPLYRRGDHFAHLRAVDHDAALATFPLARGLLAPVKRLVEGTHKLAAVSLLFMFSAL
ncbi:hypothetical protein F0A11_11650, partial [Klebsiella pneumoniae]